MNCSQPDNIIFFDGVCNLCSGFVQFILRNESSDSLFFSSLQSTFAKEFFEKMMNTDEYLSLTNSKGDFQTIYFYSNGKLFTHSSAVLQIAKYLKSPFHLVQYFKIVPVGLRDVLYKFIARNRYSILGKKEACWIPQPHLMKRFLN